MDADTRFDIQAELDRLWVAATKREREYGGEHAQQRAQAQVNETAVSLARIEEIVDSYAFDEVESASKYSW